MGRRNRQRREEKRRRQRAAANSRAGTGSFPRNIQARADATRPGTGTGATGPDVDRLLAAAARAFQASDERLLDELLHQLVELWDPPSGATTAPAALADRLEQAVRAAWPAGWQPADLARIVRRDLGARHTRLAVAVVASEAASWCTRPDVDPQWLSQLASLGADARGRPGDGYLSRWARAERLSAAEALRCGVELLGALWLLPPLPLLGPPPSEWHHTRSGPASRRPPAWSSSIDPKLLGRVRALLAKAESTTFPEEAEALTAKAQQLMTRHAIDRAMLGASDPEQAPAGRRLSVDDPYAAAKSLLLSEVAEASRCRAVWSSGLGFSTVLGFEVDLEVVEVLYTSLLVQATTAMVAAGSAPYAGRRPRTRSFRQSFLVAYARRIGRRLRDAASDTVAEAETTHGGDLLPVLAGRAEEIDEVCRATFPSLRKHNPGAHDSWGWAAGVLAADQASLAVGPELAHSQ